MLLRVFGWIVALTLIVTTLLFSTLAFGRAIAKERALAAVPAGYARGILALQRSLADAIAKGQAPQYGHPFPMPSAPPEVCITNDLPCTLRAREAVALTTVSDPQPGRPCVNGQDCALNLQESRYVQEGRAAASVRTTILDVADSPVVERMKYVTLRTFVIYPYVAVLGERDGSVNDLAASAAEGEDGGTIATSELDDTRLHVIYQNAGDGSQTAGDAWSTQGWANSNGNVSAWSR